MRTTSKGELPGPAPKGAGPTTTLMEASMDQAQPNDVAAVADPSVERCQDNARRLQILRERLAAGRKETVHEADDRNLVSQGDAPD